MAETKILKCAAETRINQIIQQLSELDINTSPDELIIRNAEELLLIREYREQKLEQLKKSAREKLKF